MEHSNYTTWLAWRKGQRLALEIAALARSAFPTHERFRLTDQIIRSARSVGSNLSESYGKRRYIKHFIAKLTDAISENYETQNWLYLAQGEGYIDKETCEKYLLKSQEVGKLLSYMHNNPDKFRKYR